jgi:HAD superfamily hydrolase (TIGR01549 family)
MGGDQLVPAAAGEQFEEEHGEEVRERHTALFDAMLEGISPLPGAHDLLAALKAEGLRVVIATSSGRDHLDVFLDLVDARGVVDGWTGKDDVDTSKPAPDVIDAALEQAGTRDAVMIGDSVWDVESARRAGIPTVCLLSGGFGRGELVDAGAVAVYESAAELAANVRELRS